MIDDFHVTWWVSNVIFYVLVCYVRAYLDVRNKSKDPCLVKQLVEVRYLHIQIIRSDINQSLTQQFSLECKILGLVRWCTLRAFTFPSQVSLEKLRYWPKTFNQYLYYGKNDTIFSCSGFPNLLLEAQKSMSTYWWGCYTLLTYRCSS